MFLIPNFIPKTIEDLKSKEPKDDSAEVAKKEAQLSAQLRDNLRHQVPAGLRHGRPAGASPPSSEEFQHEGDDNGNVTDGLQADIGAESSDDMVDAEDDVSNTSWSSIT